MASPSLQSNATRVLVLGYTPSPLEPILEKSGCTVFSKDTPLEENDTQDIDFIVSYGYRHIIRQEVLDLLPDRVINLHVSYLPWNRGADPNLWSFLEDTPKGVTIHFMDAGIDTGDIITQQHVSMNDKTETLASSYDKLRLAIEELFQSIWPSIMNGSAPRTKQQGKGTYHRLSDKAAYAELWRDKEWGTPITELVGKALSK